MTAAAEKLPFRTELKQLLHLITHSLYSNKEIFLRELISNASDAINKIKFDSLAHEDVLEDNKDWAVEVRLKCPDGAWHWHQLNFSMLWGQGRVDAWLATATDIHDLRRALQVAQESGEHLRLAAEAAQLGVYSFVQFIS